MSHKRPPIQIPNPHSQTRPRLITLCDRTDHFFASCLLKSVFSFKELLLEFSSATNSCKQPSNLGLTFTEGLILLGYLRVPRSRKGQPVCSSRSDSGDGTKKTKVLVPPHHYVKLLEMASINSFFKQRAKKVVSDSPGLVDFAVKLLG